MSQKPQWQYTEYMCMSNPPIAALKFDGSYVKCFIREAVPSQASQIYNRDSLPGHKTQTCFQPSHASQVYKDSLTSHKTQTCFQMHLYVVDSKKTISLAEHSIIAVICLSATERADLLGHNVRLLTAYRTALFVFLY